MTDSELNSLVARCETFAQRHGLAPTRAMLSAEECAAIGDKIRDAAAQDDEETKEQIELVLRLAARFGELGKPDDALSTLRVLTAPSSKAIPHYQKEGDTDGYLC